MGSVWINLRTSPTRENGDQLLLLLGGLKQLAGLARLV